uniref:PICALM interacting mitotic regulator n=1 Tax=Gorilla gorilla gorilla TaxID=9595 RepID=A0A2I2Z7Y8_GORGO
MGMGASVRRKSLQHQEQLEDSKELQPLASHQETSTGALSTLSRQFQRRLPLRAVNLSLQAGPSWKRLETPEPGPQGLQAAAPSAKSALGAKSQRIQESCQSSTEWLVETQVKARRRKRGAQRASTRLSGAAPAHSAADPWEKELSRREAAFRSPYSSEEPLCSPSESDSDRGTAGAGTQHLQKLSQELDEAIMAEESGDMTVSLIHDGGSALQFCPAGNKTCLTTEASYPRMSVLPMSFLEEPPRSHQYPWAMLTRT